MDQALGALEEWIKKSPHLQQIRQDRQVIKNTFISLFLLQFLLFFLRGCGHSVEKTKKGLDFYFSVKSSLPAWFSGWDPTQVRLPLNEMHLHLCVETPSQDMQLHLIVEIPSQ